VAVPFQDRFKARSHCEARFFIHANRPLSINTIILPCEVKGRELNSKLLLAGLMAERGYRVIVGARNAIHLRLSEFDRSVYLGKDVRFSSGQIVKILQGLGHVFVAHDEEAQFYYSRENYLKARVDREVFQAARELLAWGPDNAAAWQQSKYYNGRPISITGNGRMDLLRPELRGIYRAEAECHRTKHGPYILVSSNFSSLNHFIPNLTISKPASATRQTASGKWAAELAIHRQSLFEAFLSILPQLAAAFPQHRIIARPHPAENHAIWLKAAANHNNVVVSNEGDILPWLLGAQVLIHNGCTTGLEAYLMDRHAVAFQPHQSPGHDLELPNRLSAKATSAAELIEHLNGELVRSSGPQSLQTKSRDEFLAQYVYATPDVLASERMADILEKLAKDPGPDSTYFDKLQGKTRTALRAGIKEWNSGKQTHKSSRNYSLHRFPETGAAEIEARLQGLASVLQRFKTVCVKELGNSIFVLCQER
jgi:surface carbohydrate biosynthesis protein